MRKIMIFILLLGLSGCAFVFENVNEPESRGLKFGMTKDEVASTIGLPQRKSMVNMKGKDYEVWEYPKEGLTAKKIKPLGSSYYRVFFLNGKVDRWNEGRVYAQPEYKFMDETSGGEEIQKGGLK